MYCLLLLCFYQNVHLQFTREVFVITTADVALEWAVAWQLIPLLTFNSELTWKVLFHKWSFHMNNCVISWSDWQQRSWYLNAYITNGRSLRDGPWNWNLKRSNPTTKYIHVNLLLYFELCRLKGKCRISFDKEFVWGLFQICQTNFEFFRNCGAAVWCWDCTNCLSGKSLSCNLHL